MLSLKNRQNFQTLHDALTLKGGYEHAIIYLETGKTPITISRTQFVQKVYRYGRALKQQGIQATDLIIIAHPNTLESIFAFWGAVIIGAIPSIFPTLTEKLDPDIYIQNLEKIVTFSYVKAIITTEDFRNLIKDVVSCPIISISNTESDANINLANVDEQSIALLQHSSGTTGLQKGIALSHRAVLNQLAAYSDAIALSTDDIIVSWLPLYHDMGLITGFLLPLIQGIPLVMMSPFDWVAHPSLLLQAIDVYSGTLCWLPNFAYNHMARRIRKRDSESISLISMRAFINCSEPVRHDSHQKFLERFADCGVNQSQFAVSYAMAENTFAVTQTPIGNYPTLDNIDPIDLQEKNIARPTHSGIDVISCGKPIKNTAVQIISDNGQKLREREVGELLIKSNCMLNDYHNRPDLEPFINGWYSTGDIGYIADGEIYIIGRKKDLIINAGKNIYPQDIEAIVNTIEGVHQGRCVVFGISDEREGTELIVVIVELDKDINGNKKNLKKTIRQCITEQSSVSATYITLVESKWLIKTSSGKIARDANRNKWIQEFKKLL